MKLLSLDEILDIPTDLAIAEPTSRELETRLDEIMRDYFPAFDEQRRNIPRAHGLRGEAIGLAKEGIAAFAGGKSADAQRYLKEATEKIGQLRGLTMPIGMREELATSAEKEVVEFVLFMFLYPLVINSPSISDEKIAIALRRLPDEKSLGVREHVWLGGLGDVPSEIHKWMENLINTRSLPNVTINLMRARLQDFSSAIARKLKPFERIPSAITLEGSRRADGGRSSNFWSEVVRRPEFTASAIRTQRASRK